MMLWFRRFVARPWWTIVKLHLSTFMGRPYFKVFIFQTDKIGNVGIDAHYNIHFLYALDAAYEEAGSDIYSRGMDEQAKVSIYLYDTIGSIAENYMPAPEIDLGEDDIGADIPAMGFRGGEEVRQVVDLANTNDSHLDIQMG